MQESLQVNMHDHMGSSDDFGAEEVKGNLDTELDDFQDAIEDSDTSDILLIHLTKCKNNLHPTDLHRMISKGHLDFNPFKMLNQASVLEDSGRLK